MNPETAVTLLRLALAGLGAVDAWRRTASPEQLKAFVDAIRADGGTVDLPAVDRVIADMRDSGAALDAQIAAARG